MAATITDSVDCGAHVERAARTHARRERIALSRAANGTGREPAALLRARDEFLRRRLAAGRREAAREHARRRCAAWRSTSAATAAATRPPIPRPTSGRDSRRTSPRSRRRSRRRSARRVARRRPFERRDVAARRGGHASRALRRAGRVEPVLFERRDGSRRGLVRGLVVPRDRRAAPPRSLRVARRRARAAAREAAVRGLRSPPPSTRCCAACSRRTATA